MTCLTTASLPTKLERNKQLILFSKRFVVHRKKKRSPQSYSSTATKGFNTLHRHTSPWHEIMALRLPCQEEEIVMITLWLKTSLEYWSPNAWEGTSRNPLLTQGNSLTTLYFSTTMSGFNLKQNWRRSKNDASSCNFEYSCDRGFYLCLINGVQFKPPRGCYGDGEKWIPR